MYISNGRGHAGPLGASHIERHHELLRGEDGRHRPDVPRGAGPLDVLHFEPGPERHRRGCGVQGLPEGGRVGAAPSVGHGRWCWLDMAGRCGVEVPCKPWLSEVYSWCFTPQVLANWAQPFAAKNNNNNITPVMTVGEKRFWLADPAPPPGGHPFGVRNSLAAAGGGWRHFQYDAEP